MSCARGCCSTQAEHYRSVRLSAGPSVQESRERRLSRDLDAFQRMSEAGAAPRNIVGAASLASGAESRVEIERGHLIRNDRLRSEVEQASSPGAA